MPHSCDVVALDEFFAAAEPELRSLFDRFVAAASASGAVTVNATKSRIALQARMRFAGIDRPRKHHLVANFVLTTPIESARLTRVEYCRRTTTCTGCACGEPADVDAELAGWLAQAYQVGAQRHVTDPGWPRLRDPPSWVR